MIASSFGDRRVSVGRVFDRAFATIFHNPLVTLVLAFVFGVIPSVTILYLITQVPPYSLVMTVGSIALPGGFALALLRWFMGLVIGAIALGALTRSVIAEHEGCKAGFGESLGALGVVLIPLIGLSLILGIGVVIGTTILIIPGILIYTLWSVAAPALVEEREGAFLALSRSQELVAGARWKIFAILLVTTVALTIFGGAIGLLMLMLGSPLSGAQWTLTRFFVTIILSLIGNVVGSTVQASLYVELREWKEGGSVENLEQVFA